jgi:hypothetical protein
MVVYTNINRNVHAHSWIRQHCERERERDFLCVHTCTRVHFHVFYRVTCDAQPRHNVAASHSVFCHIKSLQNLKLLWINQELINVLIKRWLIHIWMRDNWHINKEMIITQLISIMRINWPSNREDFKLLDVRRCDRHRGSDEPPVCVQWVVWLPQRPVWSPAFAQRQTIRLMIISGFY